MNFIINKTDYAGELSCIQELILVLIVILLFWLHLSWRLGKRRNGVTGIEGLYFLAYEVDRTFGLLTFFNPLQYVISIDFGHLL